MSTIYYAHTHSEARPIGIAKVIAPEADQSFYTPYAPESAGSPWANIFRTIGKAMLVGTTIVGGLLLHLNAPEGPVTPDHQNEQFQPQIHGVGGVHMNPNGMDPSVRVNPYELPR